MRTRVPAMTKLVVDRPLAAASAAVLRPLAAAIPESVSPGATRGPPVGDDPVVAPLLVDEATGATATVPRGGTRRCVPAITWLVEDRPLAAASEAVDRPLAAAMP